MKVSNVKTYESDGHRFTIKVSTSEGRDKPWIHLCLSEYERDRYSYEIPGFSELCKLINDFRIEFKKEYNVDLFEYNPNGSENNDQECD